MIIRRSFSFCAAHIVRNCTSLRCSRSLHGHNYKVEIFLKADRLDNAGMILDFGIFKKEIATFIDSFDHAHHFWNREAEEWKEFCKKASKRYVELCLNPSAENYALIFLFFIDKILGAMEFGNNEGALWVDSVRVHETDHGYAQAFAQDLQNPNFLKHLSLDGVCFSPGITEEWQDPQLLQKLKNYYKDPTLPKPFVNPSPEQQIS
ncbi:6-pyruvoyl trahydropterin synthase family protein [Helicobacter mustelae]|uniref:6-carboxy-5,6,7,8-tetrahydropterin synthase n=1 Tax=Helicobacter mustelae (strain ATCC 43772 / CCUG 25715 / CIP 103759 / LMG 18044 / NCTC 12198 / R85-136P) TaxID=679897 RepID=D3UHV5_HELM1|nr:6-pyruvoyl tetrahydropterin synthase family protein [Helicobacter mustelae]CBG40078.1 Putative 6-pyruvoyl tetrahydrobiopterin synthase [Helicobacter mustelae 12198]SQH71592.1 6-pyruvoyl tetrahydrobiopterin synthase [Helicobacter mustelae]STP12716.1 6-pyruvoyl tetrahydrobiopterin synthase [Helicobacter mustelae]